jgi:hypothetical protein
MPAELILGFHLSIIAFNLFGLIAIPLGAWRGWSFVHAPLWRLLHIASLGVVALQAAMGRACFLTLWQGAVEGRSGVSTPLLMKWVNSLIFWSLPMWAFALIYLCAFGYVLALLRLVPLRWK